MPFGSCDLSALDPVGEALLAAMAALAELLGATVAEPPLGFAAVKGARGAGVVPEPGATAFAAEAPGGVAAGVRVCAEATRTETTGRSPALGSVGAFPDRVKATAAVASMAAVIVIAMFATYSFVMVLPWYLPAQSSASVVRAGSRIGLLG